MEYTYAPSKTRKTDPRAVWYYTGSDPMLPDTVHQIYGHVSPAEMNLLHDLAAACPQNGVIVEIGSFQGKSTVCLGLGAKQSGASVFAIDPHENYQVNESTHYGMENHAALLKNLVDHEVADVVRVIALKSEQVIEQFVVGIDLLWIDGSHEYRDAYHDLIGWSQYVWENGKIVLHDSTGHFPAVSQVMQEFVMTRNWKVSHQVDGSTVLERSNV